MLLLTGGPPQAVREAARRHPWLVMGRLQVGFEGGRPAGSMSIVRRNFIENSDRSYGL